MNVNPAGGYRYLRLNSLLSGAPAVRRKWVWGLLAGTAVRLLMQFPDSLFKARQDFFFMDMSAILNYPFTTDHDMLD